MDARVSPVRLCYRRPAENLQLSPGFGILKKRAHASAASRWSLEKLSGAFALTTALTSLTRMPWPVSVIERKVPNAPWSPVRMPAWLADRGAGALSVRQGFRGWLRLAIGGALLLHHIGQGVGSLAHQILGGVYQFPGIESRDVDRGHRSIDQIRP